MSEWMTEVSHYSEDQLNAIVLHFDVKFHFDWMIESMRNDLSRKASRVS